ncbi:hypothetical protein BDZ97DRAFT_1760064 [Flammula alnicola]|nr:hypothetical protein BDZ97DRAFT_1760064 [Flammula alnicola]
MSTIHNLHNVRSLSILPLAVTAFKPQRPPLGPQFSLEIMPGSRKYVFTPLHAPTPEIIMKLYVAFMGQYPQMFLPGGVSQVLPHVLLSEYQTSIGFGGAGKEDPLCPANLVAISSRRGKAVTDAKRHRSAIWGLLRLATKRHNRLTHLPARTTHKIRHLRQIILFVSPPPDLKDSMRRTIGFALGFLLDTLNYSPDEPMPSADPIMNVLWNGDKHSFDEVTKLMVDMRTAHQRMLPHWFGWWTSKIEKLST